MVCWWNGGGAIRRRLKTNIFLSDFLKTKPDIFSYGECLATTNRGLSLNGYKMILHPSVKTKRSQICRRGIAVFFLEKYFHKFAKVSSSPNYDIIWVKMSTKTIDTYFCFFYAPGEHHCEGLRTGFYNALQKGFDKFSRLGKIFMLGDTNARLGRLLNDRNIHGSFVSNKNKPLLLGFLDYTGLSILNKSFALGVATYEIKNKKSSIIDACLTKDMLSVVNF